jgi:hypothetical protein
VVEQQERRRVGPGLGAQACVQAGAPRWGHQQLRGDPLGAQQGLQVLGGAMLVARGVGGVDPQVVLEPDGRGGELGGARGGRRAEQQGQGARPGDEKVSEATHEATVLLAAAAA